MSDLTHLDARGNARMVDVGDKAITDRLAVATGWIEMQPETLRLIQANGHKKGDVLAVARIAGIMAAKKTAELIPLCHPIVLTSVQVELTTQEAQSRVYCKATARAKGPTGVEMEALTAVQISLLTIYDMCKAADRAMSMGGIELIEKSGGRSGHWVRDPGG